MNMPNRSITLLTLCLIAAGADNLKELHTALNNSIPVTIERVGFPYVSEFAQDISKYQLRLELFDQEANDIIDEEEWFDQYHLPFPRPNVQTKRKMIPKHSNYGCLKFSRRSHDHIYALYEEEILLEEPLDIYTSRYEYTLVVFKQSGKDYALDNVFDLSKLFGRILEVYAFDVMDSLVYFNTTFNGYAEIVDEKTGYLYCFDTHHGRILWASTNLTSSYRGFTLYDDHVITGYGFTAEPDFLYIMNRYTGTITQTIPIKTAHEYIIIKNNYCYVRSYNTNYVFLLQQTKE